MKNVPLSQDELKLAIGILANVSLKAADGFIVFELVKKLDSFVDKAPEVTLEPSKTPPTPDESQPEAIPVPEVSN